MTICTNRGHRLAQPMQPCLLSQREPSLPRRPNHKPTTTHLNPLPFLFGGFLVGVLVFVSVVPAAADRYTSLPPGLIGYDSSGQIGFQSLGEAEALRQSVIDYFWPSGGLPATELPTVSTVYAGTGALPSNLSGLNSALIAQADYYDVHVDFDYHHYSYMLQPTSPAPSSRLAIVHQGHQGGLGDGLSTTINHLLENGFNVLAMQMPLIGWNTDNTVVLPSGPVTITGGHDQLVPTLDGQGGSALRFFIEPVVVGINQFIQDHPDYDDIVMTGLSGGGWTTHAASAIDSRIEQSIPVAGDWPLYVAYAYNSAYGSAIGDAEQSWLPFYNNVACKMELLALGGIGEGRRQIQILNEFDSCCFYGIAHTTYEANIAKAVEGTGSGQWSFALDTTHQQHQISSYALNQIIAPALDHPPASKPSGTFFTYSGERDPRIEGWSLHDEYTSTASSAVAADSAWRINDAVGDRNAFQRSLTEEQDAQLFQEDWVLEADVEVLGTGDAVDASIGVEVWFNISYDPSYPLSYRFLMSFGTDAAGDALVKIGTSETVHEVGEGGQHHYQLVYDADSFQADFLIDGGVVETGIMGEVFSVERAMVSFGSTSTATSGQAEFAQIQLRLLAETLPGDLNGDGFVGGDDLDIVRAHWGQEVPAGNWASGDISGDGFVGGDDLDMVRSNWGSGAPPASPVPEPSAGCMLLLLFSGSFLLFKWRIN